MEEKLVSPGIVFGWELRLPSGQEGHWSLGSGRIKGWGVVGTGGGEARRVARGGSSASSIVTKLEIRGCHEIPCSFPSSGEVGIVCVWQGGRRLILGCFEEAPGRKGYCTQT